MFNVQLLLTGDELMSGDIVDSNSAMIAQKLNTLGLSINKKVTVADDLSQLVNEISRISETADLLIINGGLGPTVDDLTAQALAKALNVAVEQHHQALEHLENWCQMRGFTLNGPNLKQADLPAGCEVIANPIGSAVGFHSYLNNCAIYCTPGVPNELALMVDEQLIPRIIKLLPNEHHYHVSRYQVFGIGESSLQKLVNEHFPDWPKELELGFRASMPILELKLTSKTADAKSLKQLWVNKLKDVLGDHIISEITDSPKSLAQHLIEILKVQNKTITLAESCTGGMIASAITKIGGASQVFEAGFVTYSNRMKSKMLNVSENTLALHGAVSEQTVTEMAQGALTNSCADVVIAVSGVAGPSGGSDDKPVGTVWIAWGTQSHLQTACLYIPGNRFYFQHYVTAASLDLVRRLLINSEETPRYLIERRKQ